MYCSIFACTLLLHYIHIYKLILIEIRSMAKCVEQPSRELVKALEKKLDKCRNQENNPDSEM